MRYLGIDYGEKHIGLALGDGETKLSMPFKTIERIDDAKLIDSLRLIITQEGVDAIVVGIPHSPEKFQEQKKKNLVFARLLTQAIPSCSIVTADESFTSLEAGKRIKESGNKISSDHAVAAMLILQGHLDTL